MSEVIVLCYHAVSDDWPAELSVRPARLAEQLGLLVRRGYRGVTFTEAATNPPGGRCVAVTFDDAYRSVYELARPLLSGLGLVGTVFVPSDFPAHAQTPMRWEGIERWLGTRHRDELLPMSWDQLDELRGLGWEIGSHTRSHARLTELDDAELARELGESRTRCGGGGEAPCTSIAYPYGEYDERIVEAARRAGYLAGAGMPHPRLEGRPFAIARTGVYRGDADWRFALKISKTGRRLTGRITRARR
jgi:peptidoglycan/xylan/chitin deacetylase (PgdA/CDA1 family)